MTKQNEKIFHTFLLSVYPILGLFALNVAEANPLEIYRALIFSLVISTLSVIIIRFAIKDWSRPALVVSLGLLIFYSYGHIYNYLKTISFGDFVVGRHRFLLPISIILFVVVTMWVSLRLNDPTELNKMLNLVTMSIMIFPIYQIANYWLINPNSINKMTIENGFPQGNFESLLDYQPDVYFIILDAYTRADTLETIFGYDNQPFLNELRELGVFIADCSQSNHQLTKLSLVAALNMDFVQNIWQDNFIKHEFTSLIKNSRFRALLENQGYITVAFETGYVITELTDADIFIKQPKKTTGPLEQYRNFGGLNNFELLLFETTMLGSFNDYQFLQEILGFDPNRNRNFNRYNLAQYKLEIASSLPDIKGPKFVFLHIIPPHLPLIFDVDGDFLDLKNQKDLSQENFIQGYKNQIIYLNSRIPAIMEDLIKNSKKPPIIVLIGDHGAERTNVGFRSTNLTAIYLPDGGNQYLYDDITPINIFRTISKYYFGLDSDLVEDTHFITIYGLPIEDDYDQKYTPIPDPQDECNNMKND